MPADLIAPALAIVRSAAATRSQKSLAGAARGERLRDGLVVAIAGPPNAGKSTLLNRSRGARRRSCRRIAGTTRDVIEVHLDLDGYPVTLLDTAGIRETDDPVEQEGVRRARARAAEADLVLWVVDARRRRPVAARRRRSRFGWCATRSISMRSGTTVISRWIGRDSRVFRFRRSRATGLPELIAALAGFAQDYFGGASRR